MNPKKRTETTETTNKQTTEPPITGDAPRMPAFFARFLHVFLSTVRACGGHVQTYTVIKVVICTLNEWWAKVYQ